MIERIFYRHECTLSFCLCSIYIKWNLQPFKADKLKVVGLAIELDDLGKGLLDWDVVE